MRRKTLVEMHDLHTKVGELIHLLEANRDILPSTISEPLLRKSQQILEKHIATQKAYNAELLEETNRMLYALPYSVMTWLKDEGFDLLEG